MRVKGATIFMVVAANGVPLKGRDGCYYAYQTIEEAKKSWSGWGPMVCLGKALLIPADLTDSEKEQI